MAETHKFQASGMTPRMCVICNHVSHGYHFGVLSCRACAAFFRRSIIESKTYKCLDGSNCMISRDRKNMCRACRYQKCEKSGMNKKDIQFNRDSIGHKVLLKSINPDVQTPSHGSNYIPTPSTCSTTPSNPINIPENYNPLSLTTLERIDVGCKEYYFGLPIPGAIDIDNRPSFTYITHSAVCQLEKDHVPLICKMANKYFVPFDKLDKPTKKFVLHQFFAKYHMLESVYQTYLMDAVLPKNSWIVFNGYILDEHDKGAIVSQAPIRHEVLQSLAVMLNHLAVCKKSVERLKIDDLERAAMAGVLLWQEVASAAPLWTEAIDAQQTILSELHAYVLQKVGIAKAGSRIGALMSIINELDAVARVFLERETMEKVFDSGFVDTWAAVEP